MRTKSSFLIGTSAYIDFIPEGAKLYLLNKWRYLKWENIGSSFSKMEGSGS